VIAATLRREAEERFAKPRARNDQIIARSLRDLYRRSSDSRKSTISIHGRSHESTRYRDRASFRDYPRNLSLYLHSIIRPSFSSCRHENIVDNERSTSHARSAELPRTRDFQWRLIFPHSTELRTRTLSRIYSRMRLHSYAAIVSVSPNCPQVECNELHHDHAHTSYRCADSAPSRRSDPHRWNYFPSAQDFLINRFSFISITTKSLSGRFKYGARS